MKNQTKQNKEKIEINSDTFDLIVLLASNMGNCSIDTALNLSIKKELKNRGINY